MIEFNEAILASLILFGYKGLIVFTNKDYVIVEPVLELDYSYCGADYYTIDIGDEEGFQIAAGVGLMAMRFYIDEQYIAN